MTEQEIRNAMMKLQHESLENLDFRASTANLAYSLCTSFTPSSVNVRHKGTKYLLGGKIYESVSF